MDWQPIETAPKDQDILVHWRNVRCQVVVEWDEENPDYPWATLDGPNYHKSAFSHWMPLPPAP